MDSVKDSETGEVVKTGEAQGAKSAQVSWVDAGKIAGQKFLEATQQAFKTNREIFLEAARKLGKELGAIDGGIHRHAKEFCDGFGYIAGKIRRSELATVILAATMLSVDRQVGYRPGNPAAGEDPEKQYVKTETKDGMDWLETATSYETLIGIARDCKGPASSRKGKAKTELPKKAYDNMQEAIAKVASADQAKVIAQGAIEKMFKAPNGNEMLVQAMLGMCVRLSMSVKDEVALKEIEQISGLCSSLIGRLALAYAGSKAKPKNAEEAEAALKGQFSKVPEVTAPAPAEAVTEVSNEKTGTEG